MSLKIHPVDGDASGSEGNGKDGETMTWFITHKPAYDTDFIDLPKNLQKQAIQAHAELEQDSITPGGNTIKKLKRWKNVWRYRLGDYRLIYSVRPEQHVVQLLAIGPRGSVYERFSYDPEATEGPDLQPSAGCRPEAGPGCRAGADAAPGMVPAPEEPAHVEADRLPRETEATDVQEITEHHQAQRRLMYVGCTRAMRYLFVTYDRSIPSPFLQQLSEDCWLWL